jgi:hypothetical protein
LSTPSRGFATYNIEVSDQPVGSADPGDPRQIEEGTGLLLYAFACCRSTFGFGLLSGFELRLQIGVGKTRDGNSIKYGITGID